ncbi:hypothetical protein SESBI_01316 [Sesbania bispinosa]|nr:hypothetical protein SESBI_01316 [Sesbania bispinosa]
MESNSNSSSLMGSLSSGQKTLTRSPSPEPSTDSKQIQSRPISPKPSISKPPASIKKKLKSVNFINIPEDPSVSVPERLSKRKHESPAEGTSTRESKGKEKVDSPRSPSKSSKLFINEEVEHLFNTKFKERKVLLVRLTKLGSLKENNWDLTPYVQKQQLGDFFKKNIKVYPTLTKVFYVASFLERYGRRTPRIRSWLKGKEMVLDIELVCELTSLKDEGIYLYNEKGWMDISDVSEDGVGKTLFNKGKLKKKKKGRRKKKRKGRLRKKEKGRKGEEGKRRKRKSRKENNKETGVSIAQETQENQGAEKETVEEEKELEQVVRNTKENLVVDDPDTQAAKVLSKLRDASDLASPRQEDPQPTTEATPKGPEAPATTSAPNNQNSPHQEDHVPSSPTPGLPPSPEAQVVDSHKQHFASEFNIRTPHFSPPQKHHSSNSKYFCCFPHQIPNL